MVSRSVTCVSGVSGAAASCSSLLEVTGGGSLEVGDLVRTGDSWGRGRRKEE